MRSFPFHLFTLSALICFASFDPDSERVLSARVGEELGCASTSKGRVLCWRDLSLGDFTYANPDLMKPPSDLANPKDLDLDIFTACVSTDNGIRCWGREANLLEWKARSWAGARDLQLYLESDSKGRYRHVLCAITSKGVKCTNGQENELPRIARYPDKLLTMNQFNICVLTKGAVICANDGSSLEDASSVPQNIGRLQDVSVAPGNLNACGISQSKGLLCWGLEPGLEFYRVQPDLKNARRVVATNDELCVVTSEAKMKCWGQSYRIPDLLPLETEVVEVLISGTTKCAINGKGKMRCVSDQIPGGSVLTVPSEIAAE